jgi:hypothetical protein
MQGHSCFLGLGGTRAPFHSLLLLRAVLDNPGMALDLIERNSLRRIKNQQLQSISERIIYVENV